MTSLRRTRHLLAIAVLLSSAATLASTSAHAQADADKTTARQLGHQGEAALAASSWAAAEDDFRRADALYHAPSLVLGLARAESHQGKFVEAWENYNRIIRENITSPPVFAQALRDATTEIVGVEGRRARLTINVSGPDTPQVTLDNVPVKAASIGIERFANPGQHTVSVSADGWKPVTRGVDLLEGKSEVVSIVLERAATAVATPTAPSTTEEPPHSSVNKTLGIVGLSVGGAGVIAGIITGALALSDHGTLKTECPTGSCTTASSQSDLSSYHTIGLVSTITFIAGGAILAGGALLFFTAPKGGTASATGPTVSPYVGFGTLGAAGRF